MKRLYIILFVSTFCLYQLSAQVSESYKQQWDDPEIQDRINSGIENYRKGWAEISFVDVNKQQLNNVEVMLEQQSHEFLFGANIFVLGEFKTKVENQKYEEGFTKLFNFATVPFYWKALEPQQGMLRYEVGSPFISRRPPPDVVVDFCKKNSITMKGHTLVWDNMRWSHPDWAPRDEKAMEPILRRRIESIAQRYGNDILYWDVVNEALTRNLSVVLPDDYVYWSFVQADKYFPRDARLVINETTRVWNQYTKECSPFYLLCKTLFLQKAKVDAVGFQFHIFTQDNLTQVLEGKSLIPTRLFDVLDCYSDFGVPIQITEITIPVLDNGKQGLTDQATLIRNFYRLWFSHPSVENIVYWNMADGTAAGNENFLNGGIMDNKLEPKPAYKVLDELINNEWKTNITVQTGLSNSVKVKGFYGKYKLTIKHDGQVQEKEINLTKAGSNDFIVEL